MPRATTTGDGPPPALAAPLSDFLTALRVEAGLVENAGRQAGDIAGKDAAGTVGDEIYAGAGPARSAVDGADQPADAADAVLRGQAGDLGIDRLDVLARQEYPGVVGDVADLEERKDREHQEIGGRKLERRGAKELTERRHGSRIPHRARFAAKVVRSPCRSWPAAAKYARR